VRENLTDLLEKRLELKKLVKKAHQEELESYTLYQDRMYAHNTLLKRLAAIDTKLKELTQVKEGDSENVQ
jgi:hypothetical protein